MFSDNQRIQFKCRLCRSILLEVPSKEIITDHLIDGARKCPSSENSMSTNIFLDADYLESITIADWISITISESRWTKGSLKCPTCFSKLGSFDFVSVQRCSYCNKVKPNVHFTTSKVDSKVI